jgi:hypothetical protein
VQNMLARFSPFFFRLYTQPLRSRSWKRSTSEPHFAPEVTVEYSQLRAAAAGHSTHGTLWPRWNQIHGRKLQLDYYHHHSVISLRIFQLLILISLSRGALAPGPPQRRLEGAASKRSQPSRRALRRRRGGGGALLRGVWRGAGEKKEHLIKWEGLLKGGHCC